MLYRGIQVQVLGPEVIFNRSLLLPVLADIPQGSCHKTRVTRPIFHVINVCFGQFEKRAPEGQVARWGFYTSEKSPARTDSEVRKAMGTYRKATTKASVLAMSQKTGVKYSELARLPYFNTVENFLIDPMHSILMGLVSDLGEELITNFYNLMTEEERDISANRLNAVRVPYDLGRLPKTMLDRMSARGLKAQQWMNFIVTWVCLWNVVPNRFYGNILSK